MLSILRIWCYIREYFNKGKNTFLASHPPLKRKWVWFKMFSLCGTGIFFSFKFLNISAQFGFYLPRKMAISGTHCKKCVKQIVNISISSFKFLRHLRLLRLHKAEKCIRIKTFEVLQYERMDINLHIKCNK